MPDSSETILVLKKTKLGETDLIITGFSDEGRQIRAVAKGARKPGSKLGGHLELYAIARVLLHRGRNLDVVCEAHGVMSNESCRRDVFHSAAAAVIVELLDKVSADGDTEQRLFPLAKEALRCVGAVPNEGIALIAAAATLKMVAQLGFRPSLTHCASCAAPSRVDGTGDGTRDGSSSHAASAVGQGAVEQGGQGSVPCPKGPGAGPRRAFSFGQGGIICAECLPTLAEGSCRMLDASLMDWAEALITSRFVDLEQYADATHKALGERLLGFACEWARFHLSLRLKAHEVLCALQGA
jgi:DNA repair protein RecO (recombination protein O)